MNASAIKTEYSSTIEGVEEIVIYNYFATINQEDFEQTATLFAEDGQLLAPFEKPLIGRQAIAAYLTKEAKGMELLPQTGIAIADNPQQFDIKGKVKTSLFTVNVGWYFELNQLKKITTAKIKLLASPQELLGLKNKMS